MNKKLVKMLLLFIIIAFFNIFISNYAVHVQDTFYENIDNKAQLILLTRHLNIQINTIYIIVMAQFVLIALVEYSLERTKNK
ncbi:MAG: hypothetical protein WBL93_11895 [Lutisporaceae bacterium]